MCTALRPYDALAAAGWSALTQVERGKFAAEPLACCVAGGVGKLLDRLLLLTSERLMLVEPGLTAVAGRAARGTNRLEWQVSIFV